MTDEAVVNEWLMDAYGMKKQQVETLTRQLQVLTEKYEATLNTYTDVCRRADKMAQTGQCLADLLDEHLSMLKGIEYEEFAAKAEILIKEWRDANV